MSFLSFLVLVVIGVSWPLLCTVFDVGSWTAGRPTNGDAGPCNEQPGSGDDSNHVVITFSVASRWGRSVALSRDDFTIYEDQRPQKTIEFISEAESPLRLALLMDTSNSLRDRFSTLQNAAAGFMSSVLRPGCDQAMLVSFDTVPEVAAPFCEGKQIAEKIENLRPGGGTALYDAIALAARDISDATRGDPRRRIAIVILSDGEDNQSRLTRDQALEAAQRANAAIFAVSTSMQRLPTTGDRVLKYLASETGGIALYPASVEEFGRSFQTITQQLQREYQAVYQPEPFQTDGKFHSLEIRIKSKGFTVRARKGYYAPAVLRAPESGRSDR